MADSAAETGEVTRAAHDDRRMRFLYMVIFAILAWAALWLVVLLATVQFLLKSGSLDVSDAHRLNSLEMEKARLKRFLADAMPDNVVLKDMASAAGAIFRCAETKPLSALSRMPSWCLDAGAREREAWQARSAQRNHAAAGWCPESFAHLVRQRRFRRFRPLAQSAVNNPGNYGARNLSR
jgi:hypothetical protein